MAATHLRSGSRTGARSCGDLSTPALLLDLDVLERNLRRMQERAEGLGVALRPHVKTHKCVEVGDLQRRVGCRGITVSTLYEARVFADHGFDDITWAFPLILGRTDEAVELARRTTLRLVVDSGEAVDALQARSSRDTPLHLWIKVDCGYHRAGVDPAGRNVVDLARRIAETSGLHLDGILTHAGHTYHGRDRDDIRTVADEERRVMVELAGRLRDRDIAVEGVSVGSTPGMSVVESLEGVTEARPGNYAFYDWTQCVLGSCTPADCAVTVMASVVSRLADHCVVDAGALSLSKDTGPDHGPFPTMGRVYDDYAGGGLEPDLHVTSLSQEHGQVSRPLPVGTRLRILPNHSCLTVACFDELHVVRGDEVVDRWRIWRGR